MSKRIRSDAWDDGNHMTQFYEEPEAIECNPSADLRERQAEEAVREDAWEFHKARVTKGGECAP